MTKRVRNIVIFTLVVIGLVVIYRLQFHPRFQERLVTYSELLPASDNPLEFNPEHEVFRLLDIINNFRRDNGLSELEFDEELNGYAAIRAEECGTLWSHDRPNGQMGIDLIPKDRWRGENLAKNFNDADGVLEAWIDSPSHLDNLLFEEFNKCGIAYYQKRNGENFWCILFTN